MVIQQTYFRKTIKWLIFWLAYLFLGYKLVTFNDYAALGEYFRLASFENYFFLIIVFFLLPFNLLFEALKWRKLVSGIQPISLSFAFKSVLIGQTGAFFTPNRLGEFPTRSLLFPKDKIAPAVALGFVGSAAQMIVITFVGILAASFYVPLSQPQLLINISLASWIFFGVLLLVILFLSFWVFKNYFRLSVKFQKSNWESLRILGQGLSQLSLKEFWKIFSFSALRFLIYSSQFYAMLLFMDVSITPFQALLSIPTIYLLVTYTPSFAFSEAMVRGSYAILVLSAFSTNAVGMAFSGILLWCVNYCLPMLFGSILAKKML